MGVYKYNIYPTPHISEGDWQDFQVRVHKANASVDTTSPPDMVKAHYLGLIDASKDSPAAFSMYIINNMSVAWRTWYINQSEAAQDAIKDAFAEL